LLGAVWGEVVRDGKKKVAVYGGEGGVKVIGHVEGREQKMNTKIFRKIKTTQGLSGENKFILNWEGTYRFHLRGKISQKKKRRRENISNTIKRGGRKVRGNGGFLGGRQFK